MPLPLVVLLLLLSSCTSLQNDDRRLWKFVMDHLDVSDPVIKHAVIQKDWAIVGERLLDAYQER
jgi:hypothetical protein